jgi:hypothetical protein
MPRCDDAGRAYAGSQQQIQLYVNEHPLVLNQAISDAFKIPFSLRWVSPLSSDGYREYWDDDFLNALGLSQHCKKLNDFWPSGGPHWDALACVENETGGVSLVEAKSHVPEIYGNRSYKEMVACRPTGRLERPAVPVRKPTRAFVFLHGDSSHRSVAGKCLLHRRPLYSDPDIKNDVGEWNS